MYWGYHHIANIAGCYPKSIRSATNIKKFCNELVKNIRMVPYGAPQIVMFGEGNKKGYTLVQLIETSNICAHFVEETNDIYLDVFSCKEFDKAIVNQTVHKYFRPTNITDHYLIRQATSSFDINRLQVADDRTMVGAKILC
jgi:S-adenosylmethionine/arginine decarboxylase-like enzyme